MIILLYLYRANAIETMALRRQDDAQIFNGIAKSPEIIICHIWITWFITLENNHMMFMDCSYSSYPESIQNPESQVPPSSPPNTPNLHPVSRTFALRLHVHLLRRLRLRGRLGLRRLRGHLGVGVGLGLLGNLAGWIQGESRGRAERSGWTNTRWTWKNHGKTMEKPWKNHGRTMEELADSCDNWWKHHF